MKTSEKVIVGAAAGAGLGLLSYGLYKLLVKPSPEPPPEGEPAAVVTLTWELA